MSNPRINGAESVIRHCPDLIGLRARFRECGVNHLTGKANLGVMNHDNGCREKEFRQYLGNPQGHELGRADTRTQPIGETRSFRKTFVSRHLLLERETRLAPKQHPVEIAQMQPLARR